MSPVHYQLDRRAFGLVRFPRAAGKTSVSTSVLQSALEATFNVRVKTRKQGWFGPKVPYFTFMGEEVRLRIDPNGDASLDLSTIDDEVRETLLEMLRTSLDFKS